MGVASRLPEGWPAELPPPGSDDFESTAVAWLFDLVPADYRLHQVLRRYPVVLARMAHQHVDACLLAAREGYRTARHDLRQAVPQHGVEAVLEAYRHEGRRLSAAAKGVQLVEKALLAQATATAA
jgi:hypothetical protein